MPASVVGRRVEEMRVVIVGTGAAGVAVAELLHDAGVGQDGTGDIIGVDSVGILHRESARG
jgi:malate dehydrogenase (oxaloacetate-decarboxylating)